MSRTWEVRPFCSRDVDAFAGWAVRDGALPFPERIVPSAAAAGDLVVVAVPSVADCQQVSGDLLFEHTGPGSVWVPPVGLLLCSPAAPGHAAVSVLVAPQYRRRRVATALLGDLTSREGVVAVQAPAWRSFEAVIDGENVPSLRLFAAAGFVPSDGQGRSDLACAVWVSPSVCEAPAP
jgi:GNAT superfamily N-acetyltransferase